MEEGGDEKQPEDLLKLVEAGIPLLMILVKEERF